MRQTFPGVFHFALYFAMHEVDLHFQNSSFKSEVNSQIMEV